jgi:type VI secretion system protein ImpK
MAFVAYMTKSDTSRQPPFDQVNSEIQRLITESEAVFNQGDFSRQDYDLARFAVFAWIDERLLSSQWEGRTNWVREQLQRRYYQTADAGELFFKKLNSIGPHQRDVREVYYICLAMGFAGQYCNEGDDYLLEQLKTSNLKVLSGGSMGVPALDQGKLFPKAYPDDQQRQPSAKQSRRFSMASLICILFPLILLGGMFFIYQFVLNNISQALISTVP